MGKPPKFIDLIQLSDEEVQNRYDNLTTNTEVGTKFYLDELLRRRNERQSQQMTDITVKIKTATDRMLIASIVSIMVSVIALIVALCGR